MKFKTPFNANEFPKYTEDKFGPSMTVPDQTMSLKDILTRYARGLPIEGEKFPVYHGEEEMPPDLKKMDLSEIHDLRTRVAEEIYEQTEIFKQQQRDAGKTITDAATDDSKPS